MTSNEQTRADHLGEYLRFFKMEPLGKLLADYLKLSITSVGVIFVLLYFGVLLILHARLNHPFPQDVNQLFSFSATRSYYPDIVGIFLDLIGSPLIFVFLVAFRRYIPHQFTRLVKNNLIEPKFESNRKKTVNSLLRNRKIQIILTALPILFTLILIPADPRLYSQRNIVIDYEIFLTHIARYAVVALFLEILYVFIIFQYYAISPRLNPLHPDNCNGLSPQGNIAIMIYSILFLEAMIQAIGTLEGGGIFQQLLISTFGNISLIYLWLFFPLFSIFVFVKLVYNPKKQVQNLQQEYLTDSSESWTDYFLKTRTNIISHVETPPVQAGKNLNHDFSKDVEILEIWQKLDKYIVEMNVWPIPRNTTKRIAILINPIIPILIPIMIEFLKQIFS